MAADCGELYSALMVRFPEMVRCEMVVVSVAVQALFAGVGVEVPPTVSAAQVSVPAPWMTTEVLVTAEF